MNGSTFIDRKHTSLLDKQKKRCTKNKMSSPTSMQKKYLIKEKSPSNVGPSRLPTKKPLMSNGKSSMHCDKSGAFNGQKPRTIKKMASDVVPSVSPKHKRVGSNQQISHHLSFDKIINEEITRRIKKIERETDKSGAFNGQKPRTIKKMASDVVPSVSPKHKRAGSNQQISHHLSFATESAYKNESDKRINAEIAKRIEAIEGNFADYDVLGDENDFQRIKLNILREPRHSKHKVHRDRFGSNINGNQRNNPKRDTNFETKNSQSFQRINSNLSRSSSSRKSKVHRARSDSNINGNKRNNTKREIRKTNLVSMLKSNDENNYSDSSADTDSQNGEPILENRWKSDNYSDSSADTYSQNGEPILEYQWKPDISTKKPSSRPWWQPAEEAQNSNLDRKPLYSTSENNYSELCADTDSHNGEPILENQWNSDLSSKITSSHSWHPTGAAQNSNFEGKPLYSTDSLGFDERTNQESILNPKYKNSTFDMTYDRDPETNVTGAKSFNSWQENTSLAAITKLDADIEHGCYDIEDDLDPQKCVRKAKSFGINETRSPDHDAKISEEERVGQMDCRLQITEKDHFHSKKMLKQTQSPYEHIYSLPLAKRKEEETKINNLQYVSGLIHRVGNNMTHAIEDSLDGLNQNTFPTNAGDMIPVIKDSQVGLVENAIPTSMHSSTFSNTESKDTLNGQKQNITGETKPYPQKIPLQNKILCEKDIMAAALDDGPAQEVQEFSKLPAKKKLFPKEQEEKECFWSSLVDLACTSSTAQSIPLGDIPQTTSTGKQGLSKEAKEVQELSKLLTKKQMLLKEKEKAKWFWQGKEVPSTEVQELSKLFPKLSTPKETLEEINAKWLWNVFSLGMYSDPALM